MTEPITAPPQRWAAHMQVQHRITGRVGEVQSVDFEEQIVTVLSLDSDGFPMPEAWRIENVYEQVQS